MAAVNFKGKYIHFIGIGGVSMEALARLVELDGAIVTGSDNNSGRPHSAKNIHTGLDLVIVNGAIADDNPELLRAAELGIPIAERAELLAMIEQRYTHRIAVAGTHGKSTTTAMIGAVLQAGGLCPTVHNGARPNLTIGKRDYFVTEACEFKRSFLKLEPTVAVVTNIDADHLDCYRDIDEIRETFAKFTAKAKTVFYTDTELSAVEYERGKYCFDISTVNSAANLNNAPTSAIALSEVTVYLRVLGQHNAYNAELAARVGIHFGVPLAVIKSALEQFNGIDRRYQDITDLVGFCDNPTVTRIHNSCDEKPIGAVALGTPEYSAGAGTLGIHSSESCVCGNSHAALRHRRHSVEAPCSNSPRRRNSSSQIPSVPACPRIISDSDHRSEARCGHMRPRIVVDYAHHPAEIATTISTSRAIFGGRFLVVFQPHTYTRTLALFDDFVRVLRTCDCVLYKTFSAREKSQKGGTAQDLAKALGVPCFSDKAALRRFIAENTCGTASDGTVGAKINFSGGAKYDAVILTGAGDINKVLD